MLYAFKTGKLWVASKISKGDYILLIIDGVMVFGIVFNFKYLNQKHKKSMIHYRDYINLQNDDEDEEKSRKEIGILLDPVYVITGKSKGKEQETFSNTYNNSKFYKCHLNSNIELSNLSFVSSIIKKEIKKLK